MAINTRLSLLKCYYLYMRNSVVNFQFIKVVTTEFIRDHWAEWTKQSYFIVCLSFCHQWFFCLNLQCLIILASWRQWKRAVNTTLTYNGYCKLVRKPTYLTMSNNHSSFSFVLVFTNREISGSLVPLCSPASRKFCLSMVYQHLFTENSCLVLLETRLMSMMRMNQNNNCCGPWNLNYYFMFSVFF